MAYRYGDRRQKILFPQSIDEYIPHDAPVRAYDIFVDAMDFDRLGIAVEPNKVGCPQYDPKTMLKLLVYGYSYGIRSSRKLERETHYNLSFIWLVSGLEPDFKTIAEFRRNNKAALANVLKQCARLCIDLGLIEGNTLFVDGTKVRANASIHKTWTKERCQRHLEHIDERIKQIFNECEKTDEDEVLQGSLVKLEAELDTEQKLRSKVADILKKLEERQRESINGTDSDCVNVHSRQGSHAGYNLQSVVDAKNGFVVSSDVVTENNDYHQFAKQIDNANEVLQTKCKIACADAGYACVDDLEKVDNQSIQVIVPSRNQAAEDKKGSTSDRSDFSYEPDRDRYICPEGHILNYSYTNIRKKAKVYRIGGDTCRTCRSFGTCTNHPKGRNFNRLLKEELKKKFESQYEQPMSQDVYRLRKQKVELPFGHMKRNLKADNFLMRGIDGVKAEASLLMTCFNITRMIGLMGVGKLVAGLGE
jgi:transposase